MAKNAETAAAEAGFLAVNLDLLRGEVANDGLRGGVTVTNDDHAQMICRFESGVMGHMYFSRVVTGRKMGYAYEVHGTKGAIRFDQENQNALWLYLAEGPEAERGFRKVLTGPAHPDYLPFCQGPGHGTGYQDQIIIEVKDFLRSNETGEDLWPIFEEGLNVKKSSMQHSRRVRQRHGSTSQQANWEKRKYD